MNFVSQLFKSKIHKVSFLKSQIQTDRIKKNRVKKVILLSAYNRSLWLASELKRKGLEVCYLDFTQSLGNLSPDMWDSPFGVFLTPQITFSQQSWLNEGAVLEPQPNGFVFVSGKGPIEFRGHFTKQSLKRYSIGEEQVDYMKKSSVLNSEDFDLLFQKLSSDPFQKRWFLNYIHQINSPMFLDNYRGLSQKNRPLPLNEPWVLRKISRRGSIQSLEMNKAKGILVDEVQALQNLNIESKNIKSVSWTNFQNKTLDFETDIVLNFLSQEELQAVSPKVYELSSSQQPIRAEWFWTKYRFFVKRNDVVDALPPSFALVHQISLPWTHENSLIVQRGLRADEFVIWAKLPIHYRHQVQLLESISKSIQSVLKNHFDQFQIESVELPSECMQNEFQLKVPHLPIYLESGLQNLRKSKINDFLWLGPEIWERFDWTYLLGLQMEVFNSVIGTEEKMGIARRRGRDNEIYS